MHTSQLERGLVIGLEEAERANRGIARHRIGSDAAIIRFWQVWINNGKFKRQGSNRELKSTTEWEDRTIVNTL